jgi:hypothetical protein
MADQGRDRVRSAVSAIRGRAEEMGKQMQEATGTDISRNL